MLMKQGRLEFWDPEGREQLKADDCEQPVMELVMSIQQGLCKT